LSEPTVARHPGKRFLALRFYEESQYHTNQRSALNESGSQDHVGTDVTRSFRLASDGFHRFTTDLTDTDTGTDNSEACA
jgi:hypothetical protein